MSIKEHIPGTAEWREKKDMELRILYKRTTRNYEKHLKQCDEFTKRWEVTARNAVMAGDEEQLRRACVNLLKFDSRKVKVRKSLNYLEELQLLYQVSRLDADFVNLIDESSKNLMATATMKGTEQAQRNLAIAMERAAAMEEQMSGFLEDAAETFDSVTGGLEEGALEEKVAQLKSTTAGDDEEFQKRLDGLMAGFKDSSKK